MAQSIKEKLKKLENQNRILTDNLMEAVWLVNAGNLICEYITPSIYRINGYTAEEIINKPVSDGLVPESFKKAMVLLEISLDDYEHGNKGIRTVEVEMKHKNGGTYWAEIRAALMEEAGSPLKIVGVMRDITARKITELKLEEKNRKLIEALAEKERLTKKIKVLEGLLPICSGCKRIRDDNGKWWPLDYYIREHTEADITHTICQDCRNVIYPDY
ncbi:PAS/PAC sensor domain protein [Desulfosarcina variabilis str. Montpellier]|uniref:PAS domain-containing protein n=1 Tax=Desulfosarcina variabilis TaxID=2300 RepID=UPI003AFAEB54